MKQIKTTITEDQIRQALKSFKKRGGLIRRLPAQAAPDRKLAGARHAIYENLIDAVGTYVF